MGKGRRAAKAKGSDAESYQHPESTLPLRPDVGTQPQFKKKKPPQRYRYDSSLAPSLEWDGQNAAREEGEALIAEISAQSAKLKAAKSDAERDKAATAIQVAAEKLRALSKPFLNWAGKAERMSFDVPTLPLFVHERLSTKAIIETLSGHRTDKQMTMFDLFGDPAHPVTDQVLKAYEYQDKWVNRMILGDSLVAMNSLLRYESLGGQVQMIYMDPPYGIRYGSNFQPFVRNRNVKHNDDDNLTREPEMVQAYRDTWEVGLHSYLTCMRDRLYLCRELLHPSGSIFVQISDANVHHLREVMDEVFGADNFLVSIFLRKKGSQRGNEVRPINDHVLWYAKDKSRQKRKFLYGAKLDAFDLAEEFDVVEFPDGTTKATATFEPNELREAIEKGARLYVAEPLTSGGEYRTQLYSVKHDGQTFRPPPNNCWKFNEEGMNRIIAAGRLHVGKNQIRFKKYHTDFPFRAMSNLWDDLAGAMGKLYVVQTAAKAVQRCMLMTTDPGDLVLDPTCGSGTTAFVAEQWGRRWITADVSRVPLALARQRLLTATFPWYRLADDNRGPLGGFVYERKQNKTGDEIGGIVPHITSTSVANDELPTQEILVDKPESVGGVTRVAGPFTFEATIPTPVDFDGDGVEDSGVALHDRQSFNDRMLEVLRRSPLLRLDGNKTVKLSNIRPPAKTLSLSAEAIVVNGNGKDPHPGPLPEGEGVREKPVAFVFGPENGAVSEKLVFHAAKEAVAKSYAHLYVVGFAIQPNARALVDQCEQAVGVQATYVQATPDLLMGDLLKNMRSSQIFSVCGLPEVELRKIKSKEKNGATKYEVELVGMDVFDPVTMQTEHRRGDDVPAWFLDTDYNDLCFHVSQAFFPRTGAWDSLKKALKGEYDDGVWDHLAGATSAPFEAGEHGQIAVKVIDDRGNELVVVKKLSEAPR